MTAAAPPAVAATAGRKPKSPASTAVTHAEYFAACDSLLRAVELEAEKAQQGPAAMTAWALVAVPRFRELSAVLDQAEREDWMRATAWYTSWRAEQARTGRWPFDASTMVNRSPIAAPSCENGGPIAPLTSSRLSRPIEQFTL